MLFLLLSPLLTPGVMGLLVWTSRDGTLSTGEKTSPQLYSVVHFFLSSCLKPLTPVTVHSPSLYHPFLPLYNVVVFGLYGTC